MTSAQIKNAGFGGALSFYPEDNQTPTPAVGDIPSQDLQAKAAKSAFFKVLGKLNIFPQMACSSPQTIGQLLTPKNIQAETQLEEQLAFKRQAESPDEPITPEDKIKIASQPVPMSAEQRYQLFIKDRALRPARGFLDYKVVKEYWPEELAHLKESFIQFGFAPYCGELAPHDQSDTDLRNSKDIYVLTYRPVKERYLKSNRPFWPKPYEHLDWSHRPIRYSRCLERGFLEYFMGFDANFFEALKRGRVVYPILESSSYQNNERHFSFYKETLNANSLSRVPSEGRKIEIMETLLKHKKDDGIYAVKDGYLESARLEPLPPHSDGELSQATYSARNMIENNQPTFRYIVEVDTDERDINKILLPEFAMTDDLQVIVSYEKIRARKDYLELLKSNGYREVIIPHPEDSYRSVWAYFKGEQQIHPTTVFLELQREAFVRDLVASKAIDAKSQKLLSDAFKEMELTPLRWKRSDGAPTVLKCYDVKIHQIIHIPFLKPVVTFEEFLKMIGSIKMSSPPNKSNPDHKSKSTPPRYEVPSTGGA